jgi:hypothetical protein
MACPNFFGTTIVLLNEFEIKMPALRRASESGAARQKFFTAIGQYQDMARL